MPVEASEEPAFDVFISHRGADEPWVRDVLVRTCRAWKLSVCISAEFRTGTHRDENMRRGVERSKYFVAVLCREWFESPYTQLERRFAQVYGKRILGLELRRITKAQRDEFTDTFRDLADRHTRAQQLRQFLSDLDLVPAQQPNEQAIPSPVQGRDPILPIDRQPVELLGQRPNDHLEVDLGAFWGLRRSPFVAVVINRTGQSAEQALLSAEGVLFDTCSSQWHHGLSGRFWVEVSVGVLANGPQSLDDIWRHQGALETPVPVVAETPQSTHLAQYDWSPSITAGFLMRVNRLDWATSQALIQWCQALTSFYSSQASIVIDISETGGAVFAAAETLAARIAETTGLQAPVDVGVWYGSEGPGQSITTSAKEWRCQLGLAAHEIAIEYPALAGIDSLCGGTLRELVEDVGARPEGVSQLLTMAVSHASDRLPSLLFACAGSAHKPVRREGLTVAARNDRWLDAFVAGSDWTSSVSHPEEFLPTDERAVVNGVFLALLRRFAKPPRLNRLVDSITALRPYVGPWLSHLADVAMNNAAFDLPPRCSPGHWLDVSRASLDRAVRFDEHVLPRLEEIGPWWWLLRQPPSIKRLTPLLRLMPYYRAILGLIDTTEQHEIDTDDSLRGFVEERRRGRPLSKSPRGYDAE